MAKVDSYKKHYLCWIQKKANNIISNYKECGAVYIPKGRQFKGEKNSVSKYSISIKAINFPVKNTSYPQTHYHYPKKEKTVDCLRLCG